MVDFVKDGRIAILQINNPPVNALSKHVRQGFIDGVEKAGQDPAIQAIVIIGKGKTFPSGADIKEFGKDVKGPSLSSIGSCVEFSDKPVVCAIHGTALGGGLEVCLFSHYRVADKKARFGFPEVNIGLLPGGEGTVRFPRVAGIEASMDLITSGKHINASQALHLGVIDKVVNGNLLQEAKSFALEVVGKPLTMRRLSLNPVKGVENIEELYQKYLTMTKKKYKGMAAPINCLKSIKAGCMLPFQEAVQQEQVLFRELMSGGQARALMYAFFSDRSAPKWRLPCGASFENTKASPVRSAAVIGAGTMGSGIAICLLRSSISVVLVEKNEQMLKKGMNSISGSFQRSVTQKRMSVGQMNECLKLLRGANALEAAKDVDMVIEAVFENLALKREIFSTLDKVCSPKTLLCTNTSTLDIDSIASATSRPDKVVGTHFFAPAHVMKLLENVYGSQTSPTTIATVMQLGKTIGKIPVLVKTCTGFAANRMNKIGTEAVFLVEEGATPQDVDQIVEDFGMPMGAFKVQDLSGIDIGWRISQERAKAGGYDLTESTRLVKGERYCSLGARLHHMGRDGLKTGKGWYRYEKPMSRKSYADAEVTAIINKHCLEFGIERRNIPPQEILERCLFASINEGFKILEDGVAEKAQDLDAIWLYGFGFPRYRGGPMYYASQVGLKTVYERICHYHFKFPHSIHWVPSDLLTRLAFQTQEVPIDKWVDYMYRPTASNSKL